MGSTNSTNYSFSKTDFDKILSDSIIIEISSNILSKYLNKDFEPIVEHKTLFNLTDYATFMYNSNGYGQLGICYFLSEYKTYYIDSTYQNYILDGVLYEIQMSKFSIDKMNKIKIEIDNLKVNNFNQPIEILIDRRFNISS